MPKLNTADILALHEAGLSDDLIDKLSAMGSTTPATEDPKKTELPPEDKKTAGEILTALIGE